MLVYFRRYLKQLSLHKGKKISPSPFRYFPRWKKSLGPDASSVKDEQPWITFEVIDFLEANIRPEHKVFEYGGGGSTLYFTKKAGEVVTVEHNEEWFGILEKMMSRKKKTNWKGIFIAAEKGDLFSPPDPAVPAHYSADDASSVGMNFKSYASYIDRFSDGYFDCVVVDGRSRPACIVHSIPKIRKGGWLIIDNSDRDYYFRHTAALIDASFETLIDSFGPSPYSESFTRTTVLKKTR